MIQSASERRALRLSVPNEPSGVSKNDQSDSAHPVLTDELMVRVAVYGEESELEACEEVSGQGKSSPDFLVILQGEILVFDVDNHGGRREISHIYERQFTGELSLLTDKPSLIGMMSVVKSRVLRIPREALRRLLASEPQLAEIILLAWISRRMNLVSRGTGGVMLIGRSRTELILLQQFLARNGLPHQILYAHRDDNASELLKYLSIDLGQLPVAICPDQKVLYSPSVSSLADVLGLSPESNPTFTTSRSSELDQQVWRPLFTRHQKGSRPSLWRVSLQEGKQGRVQGLRTISAFRPGSRGKISRTVRWCKLNGLAHNS
jgi:CRP-like cAMP-binding protein